MKSMTTLPIHNDLDWGCFYATGDQRYMDDLFAHLADLGEREDFLRYVMAGNAAWSLATHFRQHPIIQARLEALKASDSPLAPIASEILSKPPRYFYDQMMSVTKTQHDAGI